MGSLLQRLAYERIGRSRLVLTYSIGVGIGTVIAAAVLVPLLWSS
jgi:hypothetical protein